MGKGDSSDSMMEPKNNKNGFGNYLGSGEDFGKQMPDGYAQDSGKGKKNMQDMMKDQQEKMDNDMSDMNDMDDKNDMDMPKPPMSCGKPVCDDKPEGETEASGEGEKDGYGKGEKDGYGEGEKDGYGKGEKDGYGEGKKQMGKGDRMPSRFGMCVPCMTKCAAAANDYEAGKKDGKGEGEASGEGDMSGDDMVAPPAGHGDHDHDEKDGSGMGEKDGSGEGEKDGYGKGEKDGYGEGEGEGKMNAKQMA